MAKDFCNWETEDVELVESQVFSFNDAEFVKIKKDLKKIKKYVEKNFEFVGDRFSREIREIYYDSSNSKKIYGTVNPTERKDLEEEGIELASIPWIKDKEN